MKARQGGQYKGCDRVVMVEDVDSNFEVVFIIGIKAATEALNETEGRSWGAKALESLVEDT